jgi:transposase-like protein
MNKPPTSIFLDTGSMRGSKTFRARLDLFVIFQKKFLEFFGWLILTVFILSSNTKNHLKKKGIKSKSKQSRAEIADKSARLKARGLELYQQDYMVTSIARDLKVSTATVHKWIREAGIRKRPDGFSSIADPDAEPVDPLADTLEEDLKHKTGEAVRLAMHDAVLEEEKNILEIAEAQSSPADKYQHYIAAAGVKLMRDSMKNLRGPRTVRELSELDQLIRRNLGLNAKNGNQSKMHIDISILNNTEADRGDGAVRIKKKATTVIDIPNEEQNDD